MKSFVPGDNRSLIVKDLKVILKRSPGNDDKLIDNPLDRGLQRVTNIYIAKVER